MMTSTHSRNIFKRISLCLVIFILLSSLPVYAASAEVRNAYHGDGVSIPVYVPYFGELSPQRADSLPEDYDSRDFGYITSVKNQTPYGTCWSFSAMATAEASILRRGTTVGGKEADVNTLDLSELMLAYNMFHMPADPLGLTDGDRIYIPAGSEYHYLDTGGHPLLTLAAMNNWLAFADEDYAPYTEATATLTDGLDVEDPHHAVVRMHDAYIISGEDRDSIKRLVMEYGAVGTGYAENSGYFNSSTSAYYNPTAAAVNHAVTIVGWDDNYEKSNFLSQYQPTEVGAWLVKNSWGTGWGDNGYFWISYYDASLQKAPSYALSMADANDYDYNYHYDGSVSIGEILLYPYNNTQVKAAAVYTAAGDQELKAASIALASTNIQYSLQVYTDLTDMNDPSSGTPMLEQPPEGTTTYSGFYTIDLPESISLSDGQTFSVVFTLKDTPASYLESGCISVYADVTDTRNDWIAFECDTKNGQTFLMDYGDPTWFDLYDLSEDFGGEYTLRVHALTENIASVGDFLADGCTWKYADGILSGIDAGTTASGILKKLDLPEGSTVTLTDGKGSAIRYASTGSVLTVTTPDDTVSCTLSVRGDLNGNGRIDSNDFTLLRDYIISEAHLEPLYLLAADFNGSEEPDTNDLLALRAILLQDDAA